MGACWIELITLCAGLSSHFACLCSWDILSLRSKPTLKKWCWYSDADCLGNVLPSWYLQSLCLCNLLTWWVGATSEEISAGSVVFELGLANASQLCQTWHSWTLLKVVFLRLPYLPQSKTDIIIIIIKSLSNYGWIWMCNTYLPKQCWEKDEYWLMMRLNNKSKEKHKCLPLLIVIRSHEEHFALTKIPLPSVNVWML